MYLSQCLMKLENVHVFMGGMYLSQYLLKLENVHEFIETRKRSIVYWRKVSLSSLLKLENVHMRIGGKYLSRV